MENILPIFTSALIIMIPVFFAAAGGLFCALAGSLNIALEGLLLIGAFTALSVFYFSSSIAASVAAAVLMSTALSALHAFTAIKLRANVFIAGLAVNLLSGGLCVVLSDKIFNTRGVIRVLEAPKTGNWYLVCAILTLVIIWLVIYKTPFGYRLRACDKYGEALKSLGREPDFYKFAAFLISGFLCGIGGSFLSLNLGVFSPGMSAGKGWIALVVIFLGGRKPLGLLAAALAFGIAEAYSNHAQGFLNLPVDFILAFPYVCTLIIIVIVSIIPSARRNS